MRSRKCLVLPAPLLIAVVAGCGSTNSGPDRADSPPRVPQAVKVVGYDVSVSGRMTLAIQLNGSQQLTRVDARQRGSSVQVQATALGPGPTETARMNARLVCVYTHVAAARGQKIYLVSVDGKRWRRRFRDPLAKSTLRREGTACPRIGPSGRVSLAGGGME